MQYDHPPFSFLGFLCYRMPRWTYGLLVLCVLSATAGDQEPSYNGRLLSQWLADIRPSYRFRLVVGDPFPPRDAICAMGTNAIPSLLQWISYEWSPSDKIPRASDVPHWRWHALNPEELADTAPSAFGYLGTIAHTAIPELTRLARASSNPERASRCAVALAGIGREAIPSLISLVTNSPPWTRWYALGQLECFARDPLVAPVVPVLVGCLGDTNTYFPIEPPLERVFAAIGPAVVVPALTNALQSSSARIRRRAFVCLSEFAEENPTNVPTAIVPTVRAALRDPDYEARLMATNILRLMDGIALGSFTNAPPR